MKSLKLSLLLILPGFMLTGCSSMSNTDAGILGGGAIWRCHRRHRRQGSGQHRRRRPHRCRRGALTGGLIGNSEDKQEARDARIAAVNARNMGMTDVAQMSKSGIAEGVIIEQIRTSGVVYNLSSTDLIWLKEQGVSDRIVYEMQQTATRYPRYYRQPVYVVDPPPVAVGVGFGYGRGW